MAEEHSDRREVPPPTLPEASQPITTAPKEDTPTVQHNPKSPAEQLRETAKSQPRQSASRTVYHQRRGDDDTL